MLSFSHLSLEYQSVDPPEVKLLPKFCFGQFLSEKAEVMNIGETDSTFPFANCASQISRSLSTNAYAGSVCSLFSCIGKVVIELGSIFRLPKFFHRLVFGGSV